MNHEMTLNRLQGSFTGGRLHACVIDLSSLLEAEEMSLISKEWRREIDVPSIERVIAANHEKVEREWLREYRQLQQILDAGYGLLYEEVMLVLSLRSDLQLGLRYLGKDHLELLKRIDPQFRLLLQKNAEVVRSCQSQKKASLEQNFLSHWWWHQGSTI